MFMLGFPYFTPELVAKLKSCLSQEDYEYFNKIIVPPFL